MNMTNKDKRNLFLGALTVVVLVVITFFVMANRSDATYQPIDEVIVDECVEVNAPDPIEFSKKIGIFNVTHQWQESPEGTWKLYKDLDPRNGHTYWVYTGDKIVENDCPEPEVPEEEPKVVFTGVSDGKAPKAKAPAPATCTLVLEKPINWYENGEFKWATDQKDIEKFSIVYGPTPDSLVYGVDNIPADSRGIEINRPAWNQTWFQVWAWVKGCPSISDTIDP